MYHYLDDKVFVNDIHAFGNCIMNELCRVLKKTYGITASYFLVGSGARNLILQNEKEAVDLDYNLEIIKCCSPISGRTLKSCVMKALNTVLHRHGLPNCDDSTSSLTTKKMQRKGDNKTDFSMDLCIVDHDKNRYLRRLIHEKTGNTTKDRYYWNTAKNSCDIRKKADRIKQDHQWDLLREQYRDRKNMYLKKGDCNHPSYICYIETINDIYNHIIQTKGR